jgi:RNA polymerase sigma-70 factor (ECF subfamily)
MEGVVEQQIAREQNFTDLYKEHHRRVFNLCAYLLKSPHAAEDASQDVFFRAQTKMDTYDPTLPFANWILKMASNHCIDILRRRGLERRLFESDDPESLNVSSPQPNPLSHVLSAEQSKKIQSAVNDLPDKFRVPIVLTYYSEFNYEQIAAILQIPRNTVASLLFRGKQMLREKLRKESRSEVS